MDSRLAYYLGRLDYWYAHADETAGGADSLENNNDLLIEYLEKTVMRHDSSFISNFPAAVKNGLNITTSADKKIRIYAWDRKDDPDKQHIETLAQYMTYYDVRCIDLAALEAKNAPGYFYDTIMPISTKEGLAYLATCHRSSPLRAEGLKAYGIADHKLAKIQLFRDKESAYNEISYDYSLTPGEDTPKDSLLLHFSDKKDKIYIPVIKDGIFTGSFIVYAFDGYKFVQEKNAR